MGTIILMSIIAIIVSKKLTNKKVDEEIKHTVVKFILIAGLFIGLFAPLSGYEEKKFVREILPIQYDNGKFFKTQNSQIYYQYKDVLKVSRNGEEEIIEDKIKISSKVKVIKVDEEEGKIIIYRSKARQSIWTFGLSYKKEYIIYDPIK